MKEEKKKEEDAKAREAKSETQETGAGRADDKQQSLLDVDEDELEMLW